MTITPAAQRRLFASLGGLRNELWNSQEQLSTGKKAQTYSKLGISRSIAIDARRMIADVEGFKNTIRDSGDRLKAMDQTLDRIQAITRDVKSATTNANLDIASNNQTQVQLNAKLYAEEMTSLLNQDFGGRKLFSGRAVTNAATESVDVMLDGDGLKAGLKTIMSERKAADLGTGNMGRLTTSVATSTLTLAEDGAHPFGFKLSDVTTTSTGIAIVQPTGSPKSGTVAVTSQPQAGENVTFKLNMPDGSTLNLKLTATTGTAGEGQFQIGASTSATASNLLAALNTAIQGKATTDLGAASAIQASNDFLANPPKRVVGTPATSTALVDGTIANTVFWYKGEDSGDSPRQTSKVEIDNGQRLGYGARATENGIKKALQSMLVLAADSFPTVDAANKQRYDQLLDRSANLLNESSTGDGGLSSMRAQLGTTHSIMNAANSRHTLRNALLEDQISNVENIETEEVATRLLSVKGTLEASYQLTATISRISLMDYLR